MGRGIGTCRVWWFAAISMWTLLLLVVDLPVGATSTKQSPWGTSSGGRRDVGYSAEDPTCLSLKGGWKQLLPTMPFGSRGGIDGMKKDMHPLSKICSVGQAIKNSEVAQVRFCRDVYVSVPL